MRHPDRATGNILPTRWGLLDTCAEFLGELDRLHHLRTRHHRHGQHFQRFARGDAIDRVHRVRIDIAVHDLVLFLAFEYRGQGEHR